jgi:hypothetical protein
MYQLSKRLGGPPKAVGTPGKRTISYPCRKWNHDISVVRTVAESQHRMIDDADTQKRLSIYFVAHSSKELRVT